MFVLLFAVGLVASKRRGVYLGCTIGAASWAFSVREECVRMYAVLSHTEKSGVFIPSRASGERGWEKGGF